MIRMVRQRHRNMPDGLLRRIDHKTIFRCQVLFQNNKRDKLHLQIE